MMKADKSILKDKKRKGLQSVLCVLLCVVTCFLRLLLSVLELRSVKTKVRSEICAILLVHTTPYNRK